MTHLETAKIALKVPEALVQGAVAAAVPIQRLDLALGVGERGLEQLSLVDQRSESDLQRRFSLVVERVDLQRMSSFDGDNKLTFSSSRSSLKKKAALCAWRSEPPSTAPTLAVLSCGSADGCSGSSGPVGRGGRIPAASRAASAGRPLASELMIWSCVSTAARRRGRLHLLEPFVVLR